MSTHRNSIWHSSYVRTAAICLALGLLLGLVWVPGSVAAQEQPSEGSQCYVVADTYVNDDEIEVDGADTLAYLRLDTGHTEPIGGLIPNLNTNNIEAIAFRPNSTELYAADGDRLGTLDLNTATFQATGGSFGTSGAQMFVDVDGLSFDPQTDELWGVNANVSALDVLFKIDTATGAFVPDAFDDPDNPGESIDYLVIQSGTEVDDIDDIAIHPVNGAMYAIVTGRDAEANLAIIDTANGDVTHIGQFVRESTGLPLQEVEGLGFTSDGQLFGSTGNEGSTANLLWRIDASTAVATLIGQFSERLRDIEALDCLGSTGDPVFENFVNDVDADGTDEAITLRAGDPVTHTYLIRNTGAYPLSNVTVVDDNATPNNEDDDITVCQDISIPVGETETCVRTEPARQGQQRHVAVMTAVDILDNVYQLQDVAHYVAFAGAGVGGRVWDDRNENGIQDPAEANANIDGVTVTLYDGAGAELAGAQTSDGGAYLFNNLQPGEYALGVELPQLFDFTLKDQGGDDLVDSDFEPDAAADDFGRTVTFTLPDDVVDLKWDAGLVSQIQAGSINGYVWNDVNGDGIQNDGEAADAGIENIAVTLYEQVSADATEAVSSTTTNAEGAYRFEGILAGDYIVEFATPEGYLLTAQNEGESELLDSDADPSTGRTGIFELAIREEKRNIDAGMRQEPILYMPTLHRSASTE